MVKTMDSIMALNNLKGNNFAGPLGHGQRGLGTHATRRYMYNSRRKLLFVIIYVNPSIHKCNNNHF